MCDSRKNTENTWSQLMQLSVVDQIKLEALKHHFYKDSGYETL